MSSLLDKNPKNGKMLILSSSGEGLTTNLQYPSHLDDDMKSYRAEVQIWSGFRLGSSKTNHRFDLIIRNGMDQLTLLWRWRAEVECLFWELDRERLINHQIPARGWSYSLNATEISHPISITRALPLPHSHFPILSSSSSSSSFPLLFDTQQSSLCNLPIGGNTNSVVLLLCCVWCQRRNDTTECTADVRNQLFCHFRHVNPYHHTHSRISEQNFRKTEKERAITCSYFVYLY